MFDRLAELIVDESKWPAFSIALGFVAVSIFVYRHRNSGLAGRRRVLAAMNLYFGVMIGTMAFGHLLAVTVKLGAGTLEGSTLLFYTIGALLAVPSWWLIRHTRTIAKSDVHGRKTIAMNTWLGVTLLVLGIHNFPLANPGLFNIAYHLHSRKATGRVIVGLAIAVNMALFVGSLVFLFSGQSFEQFREIE